jgi:hypothetical protein
MFLVVLCTLFISISAIHESFNFVVPPQKRECFFEEITKEQVMDSATYKAEVFLESGGNVDITLTFHGPLELSEVLSGGFEDPFFQQIIDINMESEYETQTYMTEFKPSVPGNYAICLDNRKSRFLSKTLQLDVSPKHTSGIELNKAHITGKTSSEPEVDVEKIASAVKALNTIQHGINNIQLQQMRDKHRLSLHGDANDKNYNEVFISSIVETVVFMGVSVFQIFFVRRWFAAKLNPSRAAKNWA